MYGSQKNSLPSLIYVLGLSAAAYNYVLKSQVCNTLQLHYNKSTLGESWFHSIGLFSL